MRVFCFEADEFPQDLDALCPGRELAEYLGRRLSEFAVVESGPACHDNGIDTLCRFEGLRVWVLLQLSPPEWQLVIGWGGDWAAEFRALFAFGRRRRQMRESLEAFCIRVENMLRSAPRIRGVRRVA